MSSQGLIRGTCQVVRWLRLCAPSEGDLGLIPGQGTGSHMLLQLKILRAAGKPENPACCK